MLNITELIGFGSGGSKAPITRTYVSNNSSVTNAASYTFTAQSIGTAAASRYVVVSVSGNGNSAATISSVTIGGNSMTAITSAANDVVNSALYWLAYPTGTTADIVVTFSATKGRCGIAVHNLNCVELPVLVDSQSTSVTTNDASVTLTISAGGAAIGTATQASNQTTTWTGLTEDYDTTIEANTTFSGASSNPTAGSATTVTADMTNNANIICLSTASWR